MGLYSKNAVAPVGENQNQIQINQTNPSPALSTAPHGPIIPTGQCRLAEDEPQPPFEMEQVSMMGMERTMSTLN
jgi:hypothetical protein